MPSCARSYSDEELSRRNLVPGGNVLDRAGLHVLIAHALRGFDSALFLEISLFT